MVGHRQAVGLHGMVLTEVKLLEFACGRHNHFLSSLLHELLHVGCRGSARKAYCHRSKKPGSCVPFFLSSVFRGHTPCS